MSHGPDCSKCNDTGVIETGNNDLACSCEAGDRALFNEACVGLVTGAEIKQHYLNGSPEPLDTVPNRGYALVVDDDIINLEFVSKALEFGGYEVTRAADGIEGMARYHEREKGYFNIIMSDWSMPRLMGTKMVRSLRRYDKEQKILMMSSDPESVRKELKEFRITDVRVLYKAFTVEDVIREVLNAVEERTAA
jgi:CheY-like chemotaxis protein